MGQVTLTPRHAVALAAVAAVALAIGAAFALAGGSDDPASPAPASEPSGFFLDPAAEYVPEQEYVPVPADPYVVPETGYVPSEPYVAPESYYEPAPAEPYLEQTPGGYIGGDGNDSYYYDSESGCSVIPGDGVSC